MGDMVGRFFREFALTLSAAILVSAVVSLTLTPMLCAKLLKPVADRRPGAVARAAERRFHNLVAFFGHTPRLEVRHHNGQRIRRLRIPGPAPQLLPVDAHGLVS